MLLIITTLCCTQRKQVRYFESVILNLLFLLYEIRNQYPRNPVCAKRHAHIILKFGYYFCHNKSTILNFRILLLIVIFLLSLIDHPDSRTDYETIYFVKRISFDRIQNLTLIGATHCTTNFKHKPYWQSSLALVYSSFQLPIYSTDDKGSGGLQAVNYTKNDQNVKKNTQNKGHFSC